MLTIINAIVYDCQMTHTKQYLTESCAIAARLDADKVEEMVRELVALRQRGGRLFVIGLGGSAANASHAVNDFRKLCGIEAYAPTDNVAELTARANDEGWATIYPLDFTNYNDALLVLSVGGGTESVSLPLVGALQSAFSRGMTILGIVGRDGGATAKHATCCIIIPTVKTERVTPHTEGWQSVILHAIVSHPDLQRNATKW